MAEQDASPSLPTSTEIPHYLRDDFPETSTLLTPSPFQYVSGLERMRTRPKGEDSFKFDQPRQESAPAEIHFPPVQQQTSASVLSVSLRSWSKDSPSGTSIRSRRREPLTADSLVFNPKETIHEKTFSDSIVVRRQDLKNNLISMESLQSQPRSRFLKWRWSKRNPFKQDANRPNISGMDSIAEMDRCKSEELKTAEKDIFKDLMESRRRAPSPDPSDHYSPSNDVTVGDSSEKLSKKETGMTQRQPA